MTPALRPRRSVLYMPAANARALEKAKSIPCDAIIFDLEDAVAPDAKPMAREQAVAAVTAGEYGDRELTIRCNGLSTPWGADDLAAAGAAAPSAVVIPKVDSTAYLDDVAGALDAAGAPGTSIWAMIETPTAIFDVRAIAAHERVSVLVLGTNDLAKEVRAPLVPGRGNLLSYLSTAVLGAREAGKVVLDGVYNDVQDAAGFAAECRQGVELGFDGKTLVHPSQVEPANDAWSPTDDEVAHARRVIAAFEEAEAEGRGVVTVDGRMIEHLHVANARRTLAIADAIAALSLRAMHACRASSRASIKVWRRRARRSRWTKRWRNVRASSGSTSRPRPATGSPPPCGRPSPSETELPTSDGLSGPTRSGQRPKRGLTSEPG